MHRMHFTLALDIEPFRRDFSQFLTGIVSRDFRDSIAGYSLPPAQYETPFGLEAD